MDRELPKETKSVDDRPANDPNLARPSTERELPSRTKALQDTELWKIASAAAENAEPTNAADRTLNKAPLQALLSVDSVLSKSTREVTVKDPCNIESPRILRLPAAAIQDRTVRLLAAVTAPVTESELPKRPASAMSTEALKLPEPPTSNAEVSRVDP
jgi:hypothetical protein